MDVRLDQRVLLVTGSTQGIGLATAQLAARSGARGVFITGRDAVKGKAAVASLAALGVEADFLAADLVEAGAADRVFSACLEKFGAVDHLVNAAALTDRGSVIGATPALWDSLFAANARAPFFLMQRFIKHLRERQAPGSAVNILSMNVHGGGDLARRLRRQQGSARASHQERRARPSLRPHPHQRHQCRLDRHAGRAADAGGRRSVSARVGSPRPRPRRPSAGCSRPDDIARLTVFLLSDASIPMTGALIDQEQNVMGPRDG